MKRLLLILTCLFAGFAAKAQDVPQSERDALVAFYDAMNGNQWTNKQYWNSAWPVQYWTGIVVNNANSETHVTKIQFVNNKLSGEIPTIIKNLPYLDELSFFGNQISGLPEEIGTLQYLKSLTVSCLYGQAGASSLKSLPNSIGNLQNLEYADFASNTLTSLPSQLLTLKKLTYLDISLNNFATFPEMVTQLSSLEILKSYAGKTMTGKIPTTITNLRGLKELAISGDNIEFDTKLLALFASLEKINIGNLKMDKGLDLSKNNSLKKFDISNKNLEVLNIKNGNNNLLSGSSSVNDMMNSALKCVQVDDPEKAKSKTAPYEKLTITWATNFENNFQSDCSAFLNTNDIKVSDLKIQNPVKDLLIIQTSEKIEKMEIYSITGQLVKTFKTNSGNVSDLAKGVYILKAFTKKGATTHKIIKE